MVQQQVGQNQGYRCQEFEFFDQYVTVGYESASGDASVPFLPVENCDLHGNSIVSTPRWNRLKSGHDRVIVQIRSFRHTANGLKGLRLLIHSLSVRRTRAFGEKFRLSSRPTRCCAIYGSWFHLVPDVTHVISFTRLPLFSRATLIGEPGTRLQQFCS